jgi:hypothetical protein
MRGMGGGAIMLIAGVVMVIRGIVPQYAARTTRGKRALFGLLSPGAQRVALVIVGLLATIFGLLIFYQGIVQ